ncbi:toll/interleukin-1 receptor domain-containing protein, partial [Enterobacter hormaechei]|nr:toll/interleukin-1 receptor domain-containing protein [Enterobacter hormaechei]
MEIEDKIKVFISYSHANKAEKDRILKYLEPNTDMLVWYDKELLAGDQFDDVISAKIDESDIFIFLITQDFLTSKYCTEIEVSKALARKGEDDELRIIPVILDYCTFKKSKLSKYNAVPDDAHPVFSYDNHNKAYLEIANAIEEVVAYIKDKKKKLQQVVSIQSENKNSLNQAFALYLSDLGFTIQHRKKEVLYLDDLFIYPDLKR